MTRKQELQDQIKNIEAQLEPLEIELSEIHHQEQMECDAKIKRCHAMKDKFELSELIFSAAVRCPCGAGMAYPESIGPRGAWDCSDILLGRAIPSGSPGGKTHSEGMPFAFYEVKSENQPSAGKQTTRPIK